MKVIAETKDGYLWEASLKESQALLNDELEYTPAKIKIGMLTTISSIRRTRERIKDLNKSGSWGMIRLELQSLLEKLDSIQSEMGKLDLLTETK